MLRLVVRCTSRPTPQYVATCRLIVLVAALLTSGIDVRNVHAATVEMRLLVHGYVDRHGRSATVIVGGNGISNVADIPFPNGGEISPDGERVAFDTCDRSNRGVAIARLDNSESRIIALVFGSSCVTVRWSPDATKVSYAGAYDFIVHVVDISTGVDTVIPDTVFAGGWHSWSPRGDAIAYENGRGGARRIDIVDLTTGRSRPLVGPNQFGTCEVWAPDWSPAGDRIAFTSCDRRLYVINVNGTGLRAMATSAYAPRWSLDGTSLLFLTSRTLRRVPADGGRVQNLGTLPYYGGPFSLGAAK